MRKLIWTALFIFLILLQGSLWIIFPDSISFDLLIPGIYFFALLNGETAGFIAGLIVGLIQDSLTPGFFGFHMLTRCAMGYWVGMIRQKVFNDEYSSHIPIVGLFSIGIKIFAGILIMLSGLTIRFWPSFLFDTVVYTLVNMLFTAPLFFVIKRLKSWSETEEQFLNGVNAEERQKQKQEYLKQHEGLRYKREYRRD